jgi:lipoprotein-anchoring transpeptidase ErfK/SrfK
MQRIVLSAFVTSSLMIGPALAGPLSLNADVPYGSRPVVRVQMQVQPRPAAVQPQPEAYAARPRPSFGGGLVRSDPRAAAAYGGQDLGPGMVESPYSPGRPVVDPRYVRQEVAYEGKEAPGTIIVNTNQRMLYLVQANGRAVRYGIGVGRPGFTWAGTHHFTNKREWPDWRPPPEMLQRRPDLPRHMSGGPDNPLGARALYLGSTLYRIHGSNEPWTIGTQESSGCIRMRNEDVVDLYNRVKICTKVVVM